MHTCQRILILLTGGLIVLNAFAAELPDRPIQVLCLGPVDAGRPSPRGGGGGGFNSRTNYTFLPGQRLAGDAIYFDHRSDITNLTAAYLKHFDAVLQAVPDSQIGAPQEKLLSTFKGGSRIKISETIRPSDAELRTGIVAALDKKTRRLTIMARWANE